MVSDIQFTPVENIGIYTTFLYSKYNELQIHLTSSSLSCWTTAWMQKVGQRMEQLPRGLGRIKLTRYLIRKNFQLSRHIGICRNDGIGIGLSSLLFRARYVLLPGTLALLSLRGAAGTYVNTCG